jgi:nitroreductase
MTVADAIRQRYSVRSYKSDPVPDKMLSELLEAARLAPSASNRQEWRFVVVRDGRMRKALSVAARDQGFVAQAPVVIACCAKTDRHVMTCGEACYPIDVAIAVEHIALAATELGLGTCWIGAFKADEVKQLLGIPEDIKVVELLVVGFPKDSPRPKNRLPLSELVHYEKWTARAGQAPDAG